MTRFKKENFIKSGNTLFYSTSGDAWDSAAMKFVGRFKYRGPFTMGTFKTELIKHHIVEEYFAELEAGETPLGYMRKYAADWYDARMEKARFNVWRTVIKESEKKFVG